MSDIVKNSIQVFGRIKHSSKSSYIRHYDIRKGRDLQQEIVFKPDSSGDYGFYRNSKQRYRFSKIFDQDSTQTDIFDTIAKPVINSALQGYNGTIFAYGQTGSGKTFSMTGSSDYEHRGIIPRTIQHVFENVGNSNMLYSIYISYLEIYNEIGYDLLNPKHRVTYLEDLPRVTLLEDANGHTHLRNLGVISVASEREAMCLLFLGDTNRTIAETPMNLYSSRSHCIFTVHIAATITKDGRVRRSKLHLVDLAGSERIQKSSISGSLLLDAKQINLSLHYLEQVIIALSDAKRAHVPYRNSMMTTVLKDSLGGNCLTAMLATLSIDPKNFEETMSTCKFAQRVALITSEAFINEEEDPYLIISDLKLELENLKKELIVIKDPTNVFQYKDKMVLSSNQIRDCEKEVAKFLKGATDKIVIDGNVNKVFTCFNIFKKIIKAQSTAINDDQTNMKQITLFQDQILEKENQISLLMNMLNNGKKSPKGLQEEFTNETVSNGSPPKKKPLPQKQAFELFLRQDRNENEVSKCGSSLKLKMLAAKKCADKIQVCKENIILLKKKLRDNINNGPEVTIKFMTQLKNQQEIYRENILELYNFKREATHLSHGFQQAKRRVMRRFSEWWDNDKTNISAFDIFPNESKDSETFSPNSATEYFLWNPDLSSFNADPRSFQATFNPDAFPNLFDTEFLEQISGLGQFSERNLVKRPQSKHVLQQSQSKLQTQSLHQIQQHSQHQLQPQPQHLLQTQSQYQIQPQLQHQFEPQSQHQFQPNSQHLFQQQSQHQLQVQSQHQLLLQSQLKFQAKSQQPLQPQLQQQQQNFSHQQHNNTENVPQQDQILQNNYSQIPRRVNCFSENDVNKHYPSDNQTQSMQGIDIPNGILSNQTLSMNRIEASNIQIPNNIHHAQGDVKMQHYYRQPYQTDLPSTNQDLTDECSQQNDLYNINDRQQKLNSPPSFSSERKFNNPNVYPTNYMNFDLPEKLSNSVQKLAGYYEQNLSPVNNAELNPGMTNVPEVNNYHLDYVNSGNPQMHENHYNDLRNLQTPNIVNIPKNAHENEKYMNSNMSSSGDHLIDHRNLQQLKPLINETNMYQNTNFNRLPVSQPRFRNETSRCLSDTNVQFATQKSTKLEIASKSQPNIALNLQPPRHEIASSTRQSLNLCVSTSEPSLKRIACAAQLNGENVIIPQQSKSQTFSTATDFENVGHKSYNTDQIENTQVQQTQNKENDTEEFLKSVPLTGDQEVDEEILSFYRSKYNIQKSRQQ